MLITDPGHVPKPSNFFAVYDSAQIAEFTGAEVGIMLAVVGVESARPRAFI
ncbi:MAG: hypothetical protein ACREFD_00955 [Stellaceae bacterium]